MARKIILSAATKREVGKLLYVHAVGEGDIALRIQEMDLMERALAEIMGEAELARFRALPPEWVHRSSHLNVNANGWHVMFNSYDRETIANLRDSPEERHKWYRGNDLVIYRVDVAMPRLDNVPAVSISVELGGEIQAFAQAKKTRGEKNVELWRSIQSTIESFRYMKDLIAAIPEITTIYPELVEPVATVTALVPSVERMMCAIANARGEQREGCCDGKREADLQEAA